MDDGNVYNTGVESYITISNPFTLCLKLISIFYVFVVGEGVAIPMQNTQFECFKIEADKSDETPKFKRHSMAIMYQTRCVKRKIMLSNAGFENK